MNGISAKRRFPSPGQIALVMVLAVVATAAGARWWWQYRGPDVVAATAVLRIGYAVEPPFAYLDSQGEVTGVVAATAVELATRLGVKRIQWVQTSFAAQIPDLVERRFDVLASGVYVTAARSRLVRFSLPLLHGPLAVLVPRGNPRGLVSYPQLQPNAELRIAVLTGSVAEQSLRERGFDSTQLVLVPDPQSGCSAVLSGVANAFILSLPALRVILAEHPAELVVLATPPGLHPVMPEGELAYVFHPDDSRLQQRWNDAMRGYVGSESHRQLAAGFGFQPSDLGAWHPSAIVGHP
jgi:polar amino acid transport system substrate-binding protein